MLHQIDKLGLCIFPFIVFFLVVPFSAGSIQNAPLKAPNQQARTKLDNFEELGGPKNFRKTYQEKSITELNLNAFDNTTTTREKNKNKSST